MFQWKYRNKTGTASGNCSTHRSTNHSLQVEELLHHGELLRVVEFENEDEFGLYKIKALHNIKGDGHIHILRTSFKPHKEIKDVPVSEEN
jgi:hypothetical protein